MKDILNTEHIGCGGTFHETNMYEDIQCDKCGEPSERYFYTKSETINRQETEILRLKEEIYNLKENMRRINELSS